MSGIAARLGRGLPRFAAYAYRTLALVFLCTAVLRLFFHDGGWINYLLVFLILSGPLALPALRRLRR